MDEGMGCAPEADRIVANQPFSVAGIGQCSLDFLCTVDRYPGPDTKCEFRELVIQGGGPVATALVALARWGCSTRFSGVVCPDSFGSQILSGLEEEGVDVRFVTRRAGGRSQFAFICIDENGKRTIFWRRPEALPLQPNEVPEDFLEGIRVLHLDGLFAEASRSAALKARRLGIPVVLDAGAVRPGMLSLIRHTDHLICAEEFARQFDPGAPLSAVLRKLKQMGPQVVCVTLGERGSACLWEDTPYHLPALPVRARDTTGAGDVFHAGYIYGLFRSWPPGDRFRWAAAAAALSCLQIGGRSGIPSPASVEERLGSLGPYRVLADDSPASRQESDRR
ncbi:MAG: PfkB family carbohydrate kinase [bacterium]